MRNLADVIENFIVGELLTEGNQYVLVQRNELAEKLDCAPSQISYTLSIRFTPDRGFLVESRRGTGGFIRIVRLEQMPTTNQRQPQTLNAEELVHYLQVNSLITPRETQLLNYILE
ncbi:MAG: CtsR family transcriptional regulator, partial [Acidaminococcaceae bacterium]|nr:CtsR family transcriptional regulator [Acidaminococcaceae bacterium]